MISVYNTDDETLKSPEGPIAYLIATDEFPQSAVNIEILYSNNLTLSNFIQPSSYLLTRFKPDNLMHVIHDDVLPLYSVLEKQYGSDVYPFPVALSFSDGYGELPYDELYQNLSAHPLAYSSEHCYKKLIFGFDRSTLWYQYGFKQPQGPIEHDDSKISELINTFKQRFYYKKPATPRQITILSRRETRVILNEAELSVKLARRFAAPVKSVDLETHSLEEILSIMSESFMVIGMHGSLLSTIVWMPSDTIVLELFPYAINPQKYTPYKTLAYIMGLRYFSWSNTHSDKTVGHPDYPLHLGGLEHLSAVIQEEIITQTQVPAHLCCEDPSWLYHIYQDTIVDVEEVLLLLEPVRPTIRV